MGEGELYTCEILVIDSGITITALPTSANRSTLELFQLALMVGLRGENLPITTS